MTIPEKQNEVPTKEEGFVNNEKTKEEGNSQIDKLFEQLKQEKSEQNTNVDPIQNPTTFPEKTENTDISQADQDFLVSAQHAIQFERSSDELTLDSYAVLDSVADLMQRYPDYHLRVTGHTAQRKTLCKD